MAIFFLISEKSLENWVQSEHKGIEYGKFVLSHGSFWNDPDNDKGEFLKEWKLKYNFLLRITAIF